MGRMSAGMACGNWSVGNKRNSKWQYCIKYFIIHAGLPAWGISLHSRPTCSRPKFDGDGPQMQVTHLLDIRYSVRGIKVCIVYEMWMSNLLLQKSAMPPMFHIDRKTTSQDIHPCASWISKLFGACQLPSAYIRGWCLQKIVNCRLQLFSRTLKLHKANLIAETPCIRSIPKAQEHNSTNDSKNSCH